MHDGLMQAANFDNWNPFILISGILALFTAGVFVLGSWKVKGHDRDESSDDPDSCSGGNLRQRRQEQGGEKSVPKNLVESSREWRHFILKHQLHVDVIGHHHFQGE